MNKISYEKFINTPVSPFAISFNQVTLAELDKLQIEEGDVDVVTYQCFHLSNFNSSIKEIKLDDNREIKCLEDGFVGFEEWSRRCSSATLDSAFFYCITRKAPESKKLRMQKKFIKSVLETENIEEEMVNIKIILLALRLFKNREIWIDDYILNVPIRKKLWNIAIFPALLRGGSIYGSSTYEFEKKDLALFKQWFNYIQGQYKLFDRHPLKNALMFFDASYNKAPLYQKFINLIIAIESLLSPTSDRGELTHRICSRLGMLVGKRETRIEVYNKAKELFALRGNIIHGSFSPTNIEARDVSQHKLNSLRMMTRAAIWNYIKLLQTNFSHDSIHKILDESLLCNNQEEKLYKVLNEEIKPKK
jgi:hypothetical protein